MALKVNQGSKSKQRKEGVGRGREKVEEGSWRGREREWEKG